LPDASRPNLGAMPNRGVGPLVRDWRILRRRSQMEVALEVGVSPRHLSFVETGRSRPSPELLLAVAQNLEVPLRERNTLLLAAGYAPRFEHTPLDAPAMARVWELLRRLLDAHSPYPGVVIDHRWNVLLANAAAGILLADVPAPLREEPVNVFRACLHPEGLASRTSNFREWSAYLRGELQRAAARTADPVLVDLVAEVESYPNVLALGGWRGGPHDGEPSILIPLRLNAGDGNELSLFTTLTTFGTPQDVTLSELAVELFYPDDDSTEAFLRALPET
jgi:transcriptional regulator with XRE-family HTH domain